MHTEATFSFFLWIFFFLSLLELKILLGDILHHTRWNHGFHHQCSKLLYLFQTKNWEILLLNGHFQPGNLIFQSLTFFVKILKKLTDKIETITFFLQSNKVWVLFSFYSSLPLACTWYNQIEEPIDDNRYKCP